MHGTAPRPAPKYGAIPFTVRFDPSGSMESDQRIPEGARTSELTIAPLRIRQEMRAVGGDERNPGVAPMVRRHRGTPVVVLLDRLRGRLRQRASASGELFAPARAPWSSPQRRGGGVGPPQASRRLLVNVRRPPAKARPMLAGARPFGDRIRALGWFPQAWRPVPSAMTRSLRLVGWDDHSRIRQASRVASGCTFPEAACGWSSTMKPSWLGSSPIRTAPHSSKPSGSPSAESSRKRTSG
jgi:hypothetical protein